ncbi:hypothetical protein [Falsiroseomonas sp. CW058]|uniref:hypothetical protein n=1 Tax=Falsiroseomonas sp. CW058 TaxID=3388664 RepID=UPI003D31AD8F
MEATPDGAWRSFFAAVICLPAFLALRFFGWSEFGAPEAGLLRPLAAEVTGYAIAWVVFALASLPLAQAWGRGAQWPRFICAWNWTNAVQYLVLLALTLPGSLGLPGWAAQALTLAGLGYAIWLEWFVARHALAVLPLQAGAIVGLDLAIGLFLGGLIQRLSLG